MANSYVEITVTGVDSYTFPFPYIEQSHIKVYAGGVLQTQGVHYTFTDSNTIEFSVGNVPTDTNTSILIQRVTDGSGRLVTYSNTGLDADDLNLGSNQNFYLAQEAVDAAALNITKGVNGVTSVDGRLTNVEDPIDAQDAATKAYVASQLTQSATGGVYIQATEPTSASLGDLWVDTDNNIMSVYTSTGWANGGTVESTSYNFTGADLSTFGSSYIIPNFEVGVANIDQLFVNGVLLKETTVALDFTTGDWDRSTSLIAFDNALASDDEITITTTARMSTVLADAVVNLNANLDTVLALASSGSVNGITLKEQFTAIAGQQVFNLANSYIQGQNNISVYVNGVLQSAYGETSTSSVTLTNPASLGDEVVFIINEHSVSNTVTDSDNVTYTPAGTGAVATTVQEKLRETVSVKDFGAVGDGITDDTDALVAAHATGKNVLYGSLSYVVKRPNEILLLDGVSYSGNRAKIIVPADATAPDNNIYGRFENSVFYRSTLTPLVDSIEVTGIDFDIKRTRWNAIGAAYVSDRDDAKGSFIVHNNTIQNVGTTAGQGGTDATSYEAGALTSLNGYPLIAHHNVLKDCGYGIIAFNGLSCDIHNNTFEFSGVSRDFTSWANVSAILVRGTKSIRVVDNKSFATGGTAVFVSAGGSQQVKDVYVEGNQLHACGLSAVGAGHRPSATGSLVTDQITIVNNEVRGFTCSIDGELHSAISVSSDNTLSKITNVHTDNVIDYLAPYETFNYTTDEVDGTYNLNKKKGSDVGSQYGVVVQADTTDGVALAIINDTVLNHQRGGFYISNVEKHHSDITTDNCGWGRDNSNNAYQVQQGLSMQNVRKSILNQVTSDHARGVSVNSSFCTALLTTDVEDLDLSLLVSNANNQNKAYRMVNNSSGFKLNVHKLHFLGGLVNGGYITVVDDTSGTNTRDTEVVWPNSSNIAVSTGSRVLPIGHKAVSVKYNMFAPVSTTLLAASYYKNSSIRFTTNANTHTIVPDGVDTIDGTNASLVLSSGDSVELYSDGVEWLSI